MEFKQWVENRYRHPVVLVAASPLVEQSCRRNGMDLVQMLRPFSVCPAELFVRLGDRADATPVRNFGVRLLRASCVREVAPSQLTRHVRRALREQSGMELAYGEQLDRALTPLLAGRGGVVAGPRLAPWAAAQLLERSHPAWHSAFVRDYAHLVRCSYFDTVDHPVGCIYAASTAAVGGLDGVMAEFREQQTRPDPTRREMPCMDDELHSYYLLVHDVTEGPSLEEARRLLAGVQMRYGHSFCALIKINAVVNPQDMKNMDPAPWIEANPSYLDVPSSMAVREHAAEMAMLSASHNLSSERSPIESGEGRAVSGGESSAASSSGDAAPPLVYPRIHTVFGRWPNGVAKVTGCHLSPENVEELRHVMTYYLSQCLFNFLERKLRALTVAVNEKRTTTLGKVAAWFRQKDDVKPKSECWVAGRDGKVSKYLAASLEMQMRRAGDLSLALSDYDAAFNFYRMCRNELLSTLSAREFNRPLVAACQEALGVCDLLSGRLPLPSPTPWLTGTTATKSSGDCRLEIAQNDYLMCQVQTYALRMSLLIYEYCRTRVPPAMDRARAALLHIQRLGVTSQSKLYTAILNEFLASTSLILNPPQPAGLTIPAVLPNNFPIRSHLRQYTLHTVQAGNGYLEENLYEHALRCFLRALRVLRGVGRRGDWQVIYEHIHSLLAQIYYKLGNPVRGLAMAAVPLSMGTPMYSNTTNGMGNFQTFWSRQQQVLADLGYTLCPHMVIPCVHPGSISVSVSAYHCDDTTTSEIQLLSTEVAEVEWRRMEDNLRTYYTAKDGIASSPRHMTRWREDPARMQRPSCVEGGRRRYSMHLAEPLDITVTLRNPLGGSLRVENLCLLYVSEGKPDQLWKSASSCKVELPSRAERVVSIAFSPNEKGTYIVIGFCWTLLGTEGYYYFATQAECRKETALTLTSSVISASGAGTLGGCDADKRNDNKDEGNENYFPEMLLEYAVEHPTPNVDSVENLEIEVGPPRAWISARLDPELPAMMRDGEYYQTSLVLTNGSTHRAAHGITLQRSPSNAHIMWLEEFGMERNIDAERTLVLQRGLQPKESITLPLTVQAQHDRDTPTRGRNSVMLIIAYIAELQSGDAVPEAPDPYIRLHRFLRRVTVKPTLRLTSSVMPPIKATATTAVTITATHIVDGKEPPVRVSRVLAVHRPLWSVSATFLGTLLEENAVECLVPPGGAICIPLSVTSRSFNVDLKGEKSSIDTSESMHTSSSTKRSVVHASDDVLEEEECLPLQSALPVPAKQSLVESNLGTTIAKSAMNLYFMRCSFRGSGSVGEVATYGEGALAFYLDKANTHKSNPNTSQEGSTDHASSNAEPFTPICVAMVWVAEENGRTSSGQLFQFVDPAEFLRHTGATVGEAYERRQEHFCKSLILNRTLHPRHGAVLVEVEAPKDAMTTTESPDTAHIDIRLHCHAFASTPLLVSVTAMVNKSTESANKNIPTSHSSHTHKRDTHDLRSHRDRVSAVPLTFVGKTTCAFLLLPHESHMIRFTACALAPGIADCNAFDVCAVALRLPQHGPWHNGMSRGAVVMALSNATRVGTPAAPLEDPLSVLRAAAFGGVETRVLGGHAAATTRVIFTHGSDIMKAAATATAARTAAKFGDAAKEYETELQKFEQRRALAGTAPSGVTEGLTPLFRPPSRPLSTHRENDLNMSDHHPSSVSMGAKRTASFGGEGMLRMGLGSPSAAVEDAAFAFGRRASEGEDDDATKEEVLPCTLSASPTETSDRLGGRI